MRQTLCSCPRCGGQMRIISFIEDPKVIDKIIRYLKITLQAERPPPPHITHQELLMAAEERAEYLFLFRCVRKLLENGHIVFYTRSKTSGDNIGTLFASQNGEYTLETFCNVFS